MRLNTNQKQLVDVCFVRTSVLVFGEAAHVIIAFVLNACFVVARMAQGPQPSKDKDKKKCPYCCPSRNLCSIPGWLLVL